MYGKHGKSTVAAQAREQHSSRVNETVETERTSRCGSKMEGGEKKGDDRARLSLMRKDDGRGCSVRRVMPGIVRTTRRQRVGDRGLRERESQPVVLPPGMWGRNEW